MILTKTLFSIRERLYFGKTLFKKKGNIYISLLIIVFFCALVLVVYHFREEIHIPKLTLDPVRSGGQNVSCLLVTSVGSKSLRIGFSIPSEDEHQKMRLVRELPRIKHDLLMSADTPDLVSLYKERDFAAIKSYLLRVVNKHSDQPVKALYFESFFYD